MRSFIKSSSTLMTGNLVTKFLTLLYIVPLTNYNDDLGVINTELIIPFAFLLLFGTFGLDVIITSELVKHRDDDNKLKNIAITSLIIMCITGLITAIVCYFYAPYMITSNEQIKPEYLEQMITSSKIMALGILIYAITSYFRGILFAMGEYTVVSISYISEQVIKIIPLLIMFFLLLKPEILGIGSYAYMLSLTTIFSMLTTLLLYIFIFVKKKYYYIFKNGKYVADWNLFKFLFISSFILYAAGVFTSFFDMIDKNLLEKFIVDQSEYTLLLNDYFVWSMKFIMIPITTAAAFVTVMIRFLHNNESGKELKNEFDDIVDLSLIFGVICSVGMMVIGPLLIMLIYGEISSVIVAQSLVIPFYIIRNIVGSYIVTNNGSQLSIVISMILIIISKIIFDILLFPLLGITGFVLSSILAIFISLLILVLMNKSLFLLTKKSAYKKINIIIRGFVLFISGLLIAGIVGILLSNLFLQIIIITLLMFIATVLIFLNHIKLFLRR